MLKFEIPVSTLYFLCAFCAHLEGFCFQKHISCYFSLCLVHEWRTLKTLKLHMIWLKGVVHSNLAKRWVSVENKTPWKRRKSVEKENLYICLWYLYFINAYIIPTVFTAKRKQTFTSKVFSALQEIYHEEQNQKAISCDLNFKGKELLCKR